jgi:hypothetical protein
MSTGMDREAACLPIRQSLQRKLPTIPDNTHEYHATRNHFSKWLNARALFPVAQMFKYIRKEDFETMDEMRRFLKLNFYFVVTIFNKPLPGNPCRRFIAFLSFGSKFGIGASTATLYFCRIAGFPGVPAVSRHMKLRTLAQCILPRSLSEY